MKLTFSIGVVLAAVTFFAAGQAQPMLKFEQGAIHVVRLPSINTATTTTISDDQWNTILSVYTHEARLRNIDQPVAGKYTWSEDGILFEPAYPFAPGETYHAVFRMSALLVRAGIKNESSVDKLELSFSLEGENFPLTSIESVYPQSANLPENLLRMYIYFSSPMMPGEAYAHINLLQENGTKVDKAFLIVDQELWDSDRKRFTLLFDPGRIKRDLKSNIDLGTPLEAGETYHLVIDSAWRDVYGNALGKSMVKTFSVAPAERAKVTPRNWKVIPPVAGSLGDVVILFDRPMDHALLQKDISIQNLSRPVSGRAQTVDDTAWKFTPDHPWVEGNYVITISPLLEDVAGNNLNNVFDLDLSKESRVNSVKPVELPLTIRALSR
jgi:hypothetical protein